MPRWWKSLCRQARLHNQKEPRRAWESDRRQADRFEAASLEPLEQRVLLSTTLSSVDLNTQLADRSAVSFNGVVEVKQASPEIAANDQFLADVSASQPTETTLTGTGRSDLLVTLDSGTDLIGRGGDDTLIVNIDDWNGQDSTLVRAGKGNDTIYVTAGKADVRGGAGYDILMIADAEADYRGVEEVWVLDAEGGTWTLQDSGSRGSYASPTAAIEAAYRHAAESSSSASISLGSTESLGDGLFSAPLLAMSSAMSGATSGDLDGDGSEDADDIDMLVTAINAQSTDLTYDLNLDGLVSSLDQDYLIRDLLGTEYGDANLDGRVYWGDYQIWSDNFNDSVGWAGGDFNGNTVADTADYTVWADHSGFGVPALPDLVVDPRADLNGNGVYDPGDVDLMYSRIGQPVTSHPESDLFADGVIDQKDVDHLVQGYMSTRLEDLNLDGKVNSTDGWIILSEFFGNGGGTTWSAGDLNGDGVVDLDDYTIFTAADGFDNEKPVYLTGTSGNDILYGYRGYDTIDGGGGDDFIWGGQRDDTIEGGLGVDRLYGGGDNDTITDVDAVSPLTTLLTSTSLDEHETVSAIVVNAHPAYFAFDSVVVDWGDGQTSTLNTSELEALTFTGPGYAILDHVYADAGSYTVQTTFNEARGATVPDTSSTAVTVSEVPPEFDVNLAEFGQAVSDTARRVPAGEPQTITLTRTDRVTNDPALDPIERFEIRHEVKNTVTNQTTVVTWSNDAANPEDQVLPDGTPIQDLIDALNNDGVVSFDLTLDALVVGRANAFEITAYDDVASNSKFDFRYDIDEVYTNWVTSLVDEDGNDLRYYRVPGTVGTPVAMDFVWDYRHPTTELDNELGFYYLANTNGDVDDGTGTLLSPGDPGYQAAALAAGNRQILFGSGSTPNELIQNPGQGPQAVGSGVSVVPGEFFIGDDHDLKNTVTLNGGDLIAFYAIAGFDTATWEAAPAPGINAWFSYASANEDGDEHFQQTVSYDHEYRPGVRQYKVEDLSGKVDNTRPNGSGGYSLFGPRSDQNFGDAVFSVMPSGSGTVSGNIYYDLDGDGERDSYLNQAPDQYVTFVMDVSGSTRRKFSGSIVGVGNILEAELAGFRAIVQDWVERGVADNVYAKVVVFGENAVVFDSQLISGQAGQDGWLQASMDANGNGISDLLEFNYPLSPVFDPTHFRFINNGAAGLVNPLKTNFDDALGTAFAELDALEGRVVDPVSNADQHVVMLTDGKANDFNGDPGFNRDRHHSGPDQPENVIAFGVGESSDLTRVRLIGDVSGRFLNTNSLVSNMLAAMPIGFDEVIYTEPSLPGVKVFADLNGDQVWSADEPWVLTDDEGNYTIELPAGNHDLITDYHVFADFSEPNSTPGVDFYDDLPIVSGVVSEDKDFGLDQFAPIDTDGDLLYDGEELFVYETDPLDPDTDRDGLDDGAEVLDYGTNPNYFDTDGDLLADGWEVLYWSGVPSAPFDPLVFDDSSLDTDGDGLSDFNESIYGSNPNSSDSDSDGTSDSDEVDQGGDANDASDNGEAPPDDQIAWFDLVVGDDSGSHHERWRLDVGNIPFNAPDFGKVGVGTYSFDRGESYDVDLTFVARNRDGEHYDETSYIALGGTYNTGANSRWVYVNEPKTNETPVPYFIIDPVQTSEGSHRILNGGHRGPDSEPMSARLVLPKLDLDIQGLSDKGEADPANAKYLTAATGDADSDGIPDWADLGAPNSSSRVPVTLELSENIREAWESGTADLSQIQITFSYTGPNQSEVDQLFNLSDPAALAALSITPGVRLWRNNGSFASDYIAPNVSYTADELGLTPGSPLELLLDAQPGFVGPDGVIPITATAAVSSDHFSGSLSDLTHALIFGVDLDADVDNTNGFDPADRTEEEESLEDSDSGIKVLVVNRDDSDNDNLVDFADGFGAHGPDSSSTANESFVPIHLTLPTDSSLAGTVTFTYDDSPLSEVSRQQRSATGLDGQSYTYYETSIGSGLLRIWNTEDATSRSADEFIESDRGYDLSEFATDSDGNVTLLLEAVNGSPTATEITVTYELSDGTQASDTIKVLPVDPDVGITESEIEGYTVINGTGSSIIGGTENEIIFGTSAGERIDGGGGLDLIFTGDGDDEVIADEDSQIFVGPKGLVTLAWDSGDAAKLVKQLKFFKSFTEFEYSPESRSRVNEAYNDKYRLLNPLSRAALDLMNDGRLSVLFSRPDDVGEWYQEVRKGGKDAQRAMFKVVRAEYPDNGGTNYRYLINIFAPPEEPVFAADALHLALKEALDLADPIWLGGDDTQFLTLVSDYEVDPDSRWTLNSEGFPVYEQAVGDLFEAAAVAAEVYLQGIGAISLGGEIALAIADTVTAFDEEGFYSGVKTAGINALLLGLPLLPAGGKRLVRGAGGAVVGSLVEKIEDLQHVVLRQGANAFNTPKISADFIDDVSQFAFQAGTEKAIRISEPMVVYRYIPAGSTKSGNDLIGSGYVSAKLLPTEEAKRLLALPTDNDAGYIIMIKLEAGTEVISGKVKSRVGDPSGDFGINAVGGGDQIYILDRDKASVLPLSELTD